MFYFSRTEELYGKTHQLRRVILAICAALFLGMLFAIAWISRRVYLPIGNLYANIRRTLGEDGQQKAISGESQALSSLFRRTVERLDNLERQQDSFLTERKNRFLQAVLHYGQLPEETTFQEELAVFGVLLLPQASYRFVLLRIDRFHALTAQHASHALRFQADTLDSLLQDAFPGEVSCLVFQTDPDALLALLSSREVDRIATETVSSVMRQVGASAAQWLELSLTLVIGSVLDMLTAQAVKESWHSLREVSERRFHRGSGQVFLEEEQPAGRLPDVRKLHESILTLGKRTRDADAGPYGKVVCELMAALDGTDSATRINWLVQAAMEVVSAVDGLPRDQEGSDHWSAAEVLRQVQALETAGDASAWFERLFAGAGEVLENARSNPPGDFGEMALHLVEAHYRDPGLSASALAERMGISPQYFSRVFHQKTGMSFPDYVGKHRLEKAHALLADGTKRTMRQVCTLTGFSNVSYFGAAFRKRYGVPPSRLALLVRQSSVVVHPETISPSDKTDMGQNEDI